MGRSPTHSPFAFHRKAKAEVFRDAHKIIDEEESTAIIDEAVKNFNEWGLTFPVAYQMFNNDPNNNYSCPSKNFLGLIKKS